MSAASSSRTDLLRDCAALTDQQSDPAPPWLVEQYFRHVADEDLRANGSHSLAGIVHSHLQLAAERPAGTTRLRIFSPQEQTDGWSCSYAVLQIVADDMPFLVDSVLAALGERDVHLLIHPQLRVRRDAAGSLQEVVQGGGEGMAEAWMHFEIDLAADAADDDELAERLQGVLQDVRAAVTDWHAMSDRCTGIAEELQDHPPYPVPTEIVTRTTNFLHWLADGHFTFLGYRDYVLDEVDGEVVLRATPTGGLGILRGASDESKSFARLTPNARASARDPRLLTVTKANTRSTVHRPQYLDYIGVRTFDEQGVVVGERRFLGLFTSTAYTESVLAVPVIRDRVAEIIRRSGFLAESHSEKDLLQVLESFPRDELFQTGTEELHRTVSAVMRLQERSKPGVFRRIDEFGRFVSVLVYVHRDRYNTSVRLAIEKVLRTAYDARSIDWTTSVGDSSLARLHFVVRTAPGRPIPEVDLDGLTEEVLESTQSWGERLGAVSREEDGENASARVMSLYARAFPEAYKEDFSARQGVADLRRIEALADDDDTKLTLYREPGADPRERRFKLFRRSRLILTDILPVFTGLGVDVTDERPYTMRRADGAVVHIYDFGLRAANEGFWGTEQDAAQVRERFQDAYLAVVDGRAQSDGLGALVLRSGLNWRQVAMLRSITKYLQQIDFGRSQRFVEQTLTTNVDLTRALVALFEARFDPTYAEDHTAGQEVIVERIEQGLADVSSLDEEKVLRTVMEVVLATSRTNAFARKADGAHRDVLSLKLDPRAITGMPSPKPQFEIWVYSPRVEGVHLRFGPIARGGLRWSDRREDFRTEVLGLVKAQTVKNAVIVPTGSKGGFFAKALPDPADREAWMAEGITCYKHFISGLLDLTDNLVDGVVVPPQDVVRHDGDDTYLVVAADKGTATFSDIANGVAQDYGFWLDDAFASGGSAGYDHKAMGITARGAWESVKRHFREMGLDTQTQEFTVTGVGDMSGDVFGNGMLCSPHIRLVGAFDHRHIFLDPTPDAATSYAERGRLFKLPRSSWADYDTSLLSPGGGIYPRSVKSVPISAEVRAALGLPDGVRALPPADLMRAILLAPVDLFWNGGIGTYVKSAVENNADVGDRANDPIRVDGKMLRCKVIGEGGNLGATQLGRIEAAQSGIRVNTDAIDNSAGVDTSDHEVNIKILVTDLMRRGRFDLAERDALLHSMTEEIGRRVLRDNYEQNVLLGNARAQRHAMVGVHRRFTDWLVERGELDRELEFLPSDAEMADREANGSGLTSPEFSVLVAYAKLILKADLADSALTDDPWFESTLIDYFPRQLRETYAADLAQHPLRREIVINTVVNSLVNRGGITFAFRTSEETGASPERVTRAYVIAREIFDLAGFVRQVEALDNVVPTDVQTRLYLEFRRLIDRTTRWLLHSRPVALDIGSEIARFAPVVADLVPRLPQLLQGSEHDRWAENARDTFGAPGVPDELAGQAAALLDAYSLLDITEQAHRTGTQAQDIAQVYFALSERLGVDRMLHAVSALPREDRWDALARGAVRDDLYSVLDAFTAAVIAGTPDDLPAPQRLESWVTANEESVTRAGQALTGLSELEQPGLAPLSVALRTLRSVIRSGSATQAG